MLQDAEMSIPDGAVNTVDAGAGPLDLTNSAGFKERLSSALASPEGLAVDLRRVTFIDTAVLDQLATAAKAMIEREKRLKLMIAQGSQPRRVLTITGFPQIADIEEEPTGR